MDLTGALGTFRDGTVTKEPVRRFGYKSSIAICRRYGFIRKGKVTDGARFDGRMLRDVVTSDSTASDVWADTAYRSRSNEAWLNSIGRVSRIHRKKPRGKPMPAHTARANAGRSAVRARVEHVFAGQKDQMRLFIRTIGIAEPKRRSHSPTSPTTSTA